MQAVFDSISEFFNDVIKFFNDLFKFLIDLVAQIFIDLWELLTDFFLWVFDQILLLVETIIYLIEIPEYPNYWVGLTDDLLNMLGLIGLAEGLTIIASAIVLRLTLQLIPFTRLGS